MEEGIEERFTLITLPLRIKECISSFLSVSEILNFRFICSNSFPMNNQRLQFNNLEDSSEI